MEELLRKLRSCSRFLELEDSIPHWKSQMPELKARIEELDRNRSQKENALSGLENPNFFQILFGKTEARKKQLNRQIQEIASAQMAAGWELKALKKKIAAGTEELQSLQGSMEFYAAAKAEMEFNAAQESRLMMEVISAFAPAALETAGRLLVELEDARCWMQQDIHATECLKNAEATALRLERILSVLPEGVATVGSYLRAPHEFFKNDHLAEVNLAQEQVRTVQNQLRLLLGE